MEHRAANGFNPQEKGQENHSKTKDNWGGGVRVVLEAGRGKEFYSVVGTAIGVNRTVRRITIEEGDVSPISEEGLALLKALRKAKIISLEVKTISEPKATYLMQFGEHISLIRHLKAVRLTGNQSLDVVAAVATSLSSFSSVPMVSHQKTYQHIQQMEQTQQRQSSYHHSSHIARGKARITTFDINSTWSPKSLPTATAWKALGIAMGHILSLTTLSIKLTSRAIRGRELELLVGVSIGNNIPRIPSPTQMSMHRQSIATNEAHPGIVCLALDLGDVVLDQAERLVTVLSSFKALEQLILAGVKPGNIVNAVTTALDAEHPPGLLVVAFPGLSNKEERNGHEKPHPVILPKSRIRLVYEEDKEEDREREKEDENKGKEREKGKTKNKLMVEEGRGEPFQEPPYCSGGIDSKDSRDLTSNNAQPPSSNRSDLSDNETISSQSTPVASSHTRPQTGHDELEQGLLVESDIKELEDLLDIDLLPLVTDRENEKGIKGNDTKGIEQIDEEEEEGERLPTPTSTEPQPIALESEQLAPIPQPQFPTQPSQPMNYVPRVTSTLRTSRLSTSITSPTPHDTMDFPSGLLSDKGDSGHKNGGQGEWLDRLNGLEVSLGKQLVKLLGDSAVEKAELVEELALELGVELTSDTEEEEEDELMGGVDVNGEQQNRNKVSDHDNELNDSFSSSASSSPSPSPSPPNPTGLLPLPPPPSVVSSSFASSTPPSTLLSIPPPCPPTGLSLSYLRTYVIPAISRILAKPVPPVALLRKIFGCLPESSAAIGISTVDRIHTFEHNDILALGEESKKREEMDIERITKEDSERFEWLKDGWRHWKKERRRERDGGKRNSCDRQSNGEEGDNRNSHNGKTSPSFGPHIGDSSSLEPQTLKPGPREEALSLLRKIYGKQANKVLQLNSSVVKIDEVRHKTIHTAKSILAKAMELSHMQGILCSIDVLKGNMASYVGALGTRREEMALSYADALEAKRVLWGHGHLTNSCDDFSGNGGEQGETDEGEGRTLLDSIRWSNMLSGRERAMILSCLAPPIIDRLIAQEPIGGATGDGRYSSVEVIQSVGVLTMDGKGAGGATNHGDNSSMTQSKQKQAQQSSSSSSQSTQHTPPQLPPVVSGPVAYRCKMNSPNGEQVATVLAFSLPKQSQLLAETILAIQAGGVRWPIITVETRKSNKVGEGEGVDNYENGHGNSGSTSISIGANNSHGNTQSRSGVRLWVEMPSLAEVSLHGVCKLGGLFGCPFRDILVGGTLTFSPVILRLPQTESQYVMLRGLEALSWGVFELQRKELIPQDGSLCLKIYSVQSIQELVTLTKQTLKGIDIANTDDEYLKSAASMLMSVASAPSVNDAIKALMAPPEVLTAPAALQQGTTKDYIKMSVRASADFRTCFTTPLSCLVSRGILSRTTPKPYPLGQLDLQRESPSSQFDKWVSSLKKRNLAPPPGLLHPRLWPVNIQELVASVTFESEMTRTLFVDAISLVENESPELTCPVMCSLKAFDADFVGLSSWDNICFVQIPQLKPQSLQVVFGNTFSHVPPILTIPRYSINAKMVKEFMLGYVSVYMKRTRE